MNPEERRRQRNLTVIAVGGTIALSVVLLIAAIAFEILKAAAVIKYITS